MSRNRCVSSGVQVGTLSLLVCFPNTGSLSYVSAKILVKNRTFFLPVSPASAKYFVGTR